MFSDFKPFSCWSCGRCIKQSGGRFRCTDLTCVCHVWVEFYCELILHQLCKFILKVTVWWRRPPKAPTWACGCGLGFFDLKKAILNRNERFYIWHCSKKINHVFHFYMTDLLAHLNIKVVCKNIYFHLNKGSQALGLFTQAEAPWALRTLVWGLFCRWDHLWQWLLQTCGLADIHNQ